VILYGNRPINQALRAAFALTLGIASGCASDPSGDRVGTSNVPQGTQSESTAAAGGPAASAGAKAPASNAGGAGNKGTVGAAAGGTGSASNSAGTPGTAAPGGSGAAPIAGAQSTAPGAAGSGTAGAAGGASSAAGSGATDPATAVGGKLPHVTMVEGAGLEDAVLGPWGPAVKVKDIPPGGWLVYPEDIGKDGVKHPIFIFGPGGGTNPPYYDMNGMHWDHYASYGFVIYIAAQSSFSSAAALDDGLTWVIAQNDVADSPLYQKLDTSRVGGAGHSQGSVMLFNFMPDERVTTTIHISGGSSGGAGPKNLKADTMFLCGPSSDVAYAQCETDFEATTVPTFYTNILESSHTTSGRYGWGAIVAWLLWHLADHEEWKKEFLEPDGQFQTGRYTSKTKNF
jgi:hypothetical protein